MRTTTNRCALLTDNGHTGTMAVHMVEGELMNKQKLLLLEVWKRAYKEGEVRVELKDAAMAARVRFAMYEVAKVVKRDTAGKYGPEEHDAVQEVSLRLDGKAVVATNVANGEITALLEEALGGTVMSEAERLEEEARESQKRMAERLGGMVEVDPGEKYR